MFTGMKYHKTILYIIAIGISDSSLYYCNFVVSFDKMKMKIDTVIDKMALHTGLTVTLPHSELSWSWK